MVTRTVLVRPLRPCKATISDPAERAALLGKLADAWGVRSRGHTGSMPCSHPVSVSRSSLHKLPPDDCAVALKSDGVRYALFLCQHNGGPLAVMVDRANAIYEIDVIAPEEVFEGGTILEGELVWKMPEQASMLFLVFDAPRIAGTLLTHLPFKERLQRVEELTRHSEDAALMNETADIEALVAEVGTVVVMTVDTLVVLRPKHFVEGRYAAAVWERRAESHHRVDGLIVQRLSTPYVLGSAFDSTFKWKATHTVDLRKAGESLSTREGHVLCDWKTFSGCRIVVLPSDVAVDDGTVAEFSVEKVGPDTVQLQALRRRPDKDCPNSLGVVRATLTDSLDAVTPQQLAEHLTAG